jgi:hypothetical protein
MPALVEQYGEELAVEYADIAPLPTFNSEYEYMEGTKQT